MPPSSFNPLPTCPIPIQWDVPGRIAELQAMIDDPATSEPQKINLQAAIDLYHRKELPGPVVIIQDGKVISLKDFNINRPWWSKDGLSKETPRTDRLEQSVLQLTRIKVGIATDEAKPTKRQISKHGDHREIYPKDEPFYTHGRPAFPL
ncbi:hypothetical protein MGYG_06578 [Nannizzia gypsea CBS 118893]|uniref:Uncharacterized protein n=1 Tax=Arthroderma gypseum (strain ATCC MYA-4604 / CBS 118893) TaxID=535722 RepID=E4UZQ0_ARTGP|nr:hypothetical protein MGYG_06578 [Nannizzia gypsea CBS 118893]EFR03580.1 hypothetical protein MGYG_06578 [Nannizzia gypsea CBS 118893]